MLRSDISTRSADARGEAEGRYALLIHSTDADPSAKGLLLFVAYPESHAPDGNL